MNRRGFLIAGTCTVLIAGCVDDGPSVADGDSRSAGDGYSGGAPGGRSNRRKQIDTTETPDPLPEPVTDSRLRPDEGPTGDTDAIEIAVHEQVNGIRREYGQSLLAFDENARMVAQSHSRDMAHKDYFDHQGPDGHIFRPNGSDVWAENLFRLRATDPNPITVAKEAAHSWISSPEHLTNIVNPDIGRHGVGVAKSSDDWVYVTDSLCG